MRKWAGGQQALVHDRLPLETQAHPQFDQARVDRMDAHQRAHLGACLYPCRVDSFLLVVPWPGGSTLLVALYWSQCGHVALPQPGTMGRVVAQNCRPGHCVEYHRHFGRNLRGRCLGQCHLDPRLLQLRLGW